MTRPSRRRFVKILAAASGAVLAVPALASPLPMPHTQDPPDACPARPHGGAPFRPGTDARPIIARTSVSAYSRAEIARLRAAFARMRALPSTDPRSWIAQADLHASYCRQCENSTAQVHGSWSFLPWHRAFLYYYERILASLADNADSLRLPYWEWENERAFPQAFTLPTNADNTLWDGKRNASMLAGFPLPASDATSKRITLLERITDFTTFGGGPAMGGAFEIDPHNAIHADIGMQEPPWTDMGNLGFSARDPLFFAHHANIDKLWHRWNAAGNNPSDEAFRAMRWTFYDERANIVSISAADVLDHEKNLRYAYPAPANLALPAPLRTTHACRLLCCARDGAVLEASEESKARVLAAARAGGSVALVLPRLTLPNMFSGNFDVIAYGNGRKMPLGNLVVSDDGMLMRGNRRTALVLDASEAIEALLAAKNPARIYALSRYGSPAFILETQVAQLRIA